MAHNICGWVLQISSEEFRIKTRKRFEKKSGFEIEFELRGPRVDLSPESSSVYTFIRKIAQKWHLWSK